MGVWVAPSFPISLAAKFGSGSSDGSSRFTATQLLRFGQWMAYHQNSPITSHWSVNFGVTIAFSQFGKVNRGVEGAGDFPEIDYRPGHEIGSVRMQGMRGSGGGAELGVSEVFSEEEMPRAVP